MNVSLVVAPLLIRRCPLIGLGYLASFLRAEGHGVAIFDANVMAEIPREDDENIWQDQAFTRGYLGDHPRLIEGWADRILAADPGVVGFSLWHSNELVTLALAREIKKRKPACAVVLGGPHVTFRKEALLLRSLDVDCLIQGEGEQTLLEIVERVEGGRPLEGCAGTYFRKGLLDVAQGAPRPEIADLDALPYPDYRGFSRERYLFKGTLPISFNRGCIRHCAFCNVHADWESYRHRKAGKIFDEILHLLREYPGTDRLTVDVAALNQNVKQLDELCDLLIEGQVKVRWGGQALLRPEMGGAFAGKLARAGCRELNFGLEYGSQKIIDRMKKGFVLDQAARCIRDLHESGIEVSLNVIVGFPSETEEDFQTTLGFLRENKKWIDIVGFPSELTINPDTPLADHPERFGLSPGSTGVSWSCAENDHASRQERIRRFNEFVAREEIGQWGPYQIAKAAGRPAAQAGCCA